jgi:hypothetical protein
MFIFSHINIIHSLYAQALRKLNTNANFKNAYTKKDNSVVFKTVKLRKILGLVLESVHQNN